MLIKDCCEEVKDYCYGSIDFILDGPQTRIPVNFHKQMHVRVVNLAVENILSIIKNTCYLAFYVISIHKMSFLVTKESHSS